MFDDKNTSPLTEFFLSLERVLVDPNLKNTVLKDIKSYSLGYETSPTAFPFLNVTPLREIITRVYSNNIADVVRIVKFEVSVVDSNLQAAFGKVNGIVNNIKNLFTAKSEDPIWRLKNKKGEIIVFNTTVNEINYDDASRVKNGLLAKASVEIEFNCQIKIDIINHEEADGLYHSNLKEMVKIIYALLDNYKSTLLNKVKTIDYGTYELNSELPMVLVNSSSASLDKRFSGGVNLYTTSIDIQVISGVIGVRNNFYNNLDIVETIRALLFSFKYLKSRVFERRLETISFGLYATKSINFMSHLTLEIDSFEKIV